MARNKHDNSVVGRHRISGAQLKQEITMGQFSQGQASKLVNSLLAAEIDMIRVKFACSQNAKLI
jgi:hypothetical protein